MNNDIKDGFIANLPISVSVFSYGVVLGIICTSKAISFLELAFMNIFIFAGSAQFVIVDMLTTPINIVAIVSSALLINLRYFLITASLNTLFKDTSLKNRFFIIHFVTDESWAVTINRQKQKEVTTYFLLGGGLCIFITWFLGTTLGYFFGEFISNPKVFGLDFAFLALFTAIVTSMYKSKDDFLPFLLTAIIAIILEYYLNNMFYIILSAIFGSLFYVWRKNARE
ncbi:branched-chain amino acid permease [Malaciobacter mytili]|uniref:Branched-chain amino acid permease n=1 Tax=Malaciobacter mytili LMG 24559 TaxID=1032238 RepID=A0AAX2AEP5_9BACT|nr:AzlC family ABC transporter permease [Malaciobacter mytili]AXH13880.1 branched-chain amino acid transport protein, AzlC family [Malaciobacter mytili LMG 24559]RXI37147.1 branched-chain amino acid permease [Malaciobacter mytili]RXK15467.1 branched-chain amino acid permease [Malaciobacter mytili LMG 24559]